MNYRLISKYLGYLCVGIAATMLPSLAWAVYFREWRELTAFVASIAVSLVVGGLCTALGRGAPDRLWQREALLMVTISWFVAAVLGGLPYLLGGVLGPIDSFFETVSGFTTTGSTVITDIEALPKSLLFWRSFTQWVGGLGIVVLFIAVLPYLGAGGKQLFKSETTGIDRRSFTPRIKDTASSLYKLYGGLTVVMTLSLLAAGMNFYDALSHTMTALSTGGFSPRQASVAAYDSALIESIIIFFMFVGGCNFALMFLIVRKDWFAPVRDTELRVYFGMVVIATALIAFDLVVNLPAEGGAAGYGALGALRASAFQVVSIATTTGFVTEDYDLWPPFSRAILFTLMFVGACAGSTAGGIKVIRMVVLAKMTYWRVEATFRPKTIRAIRIGDTLINDDTRRTVEAFFFLYICWFAFGSIFMSALGMPFYTALSSVASTLGSIGPGFEMVGAVKDYSSVPGAGKLFLSLCMILGRLELFSVCVLFVPAFWKYR